MEYKRVLLSVEFTLLGGCALIGNLGQFDGAVDADSGIRSDARPGDRVDMPDADQLSTDAAAGGEGSLADRLPPFDGGSSCDPIVVSAAIPLTGLILAETPSGRGGTAYEFSDGVKSTVCLSPSALCAAGQTAVAMPPTVWGSGFGFTLDQAPAGQPNPYAVPAAASGIAYTLSNFPTQGVRVTIDSGGAEYCSSLRTASGYAKWDTFNTACWDGSGATLSGPPPDATKIQFIIPAVASAEGFDFCLEAVSFSMSASPGDAGDGGIVEAGASDVHGD